MLTEAVASERIASASRSGSHPVAASETSNIQVDTSDLS